MTKSRHRGKKYIPPRRSNPVVLGHEIDELRTTIEKNKRQHDLMFTSLEKHIEYLTNFTSHDIKNAIQNMDSVVSSLEFGEMSFEDLDTIKTCLNSMRQSLDNFASLVPNSTKKDFYLTELCKAVELINKSVFLKKKIKFEVIIDKKDKTKIIQPYHNLLQVLNNLMLNSIKSLENIETDKSILIDCKVIENKVVLLVCDNGIGIPEKNKEKVFDMYFSTTNGSGIGLYHARYTLEKLNGIIGLSESFSNFKTVFKIEFPVEDVTIDTHN